MSDMRIYRVLTKCKTANVVEADLIIRAESVQDAVTMTDSCGIFDIISVEDITEKFEQDEDKHDERALARVTNGMTQFNRNVVADLFRGKNKMGVLRD